MKYANANSGSPSVNFGRPLLVFGLIFFLTGGVIFRLFQKQVIEYREYVKAAETQSTSTAILPAPRGKIYATDKDDQLYPLAISEWRYQLLVSPRQVKNKKKLSELLAGHLPELKQGEVFEKINNDKLYVPPLAKGLDEKQAQKIIAERYAGVFVSPELTRVYPEGDKMAAQVLGFVGADGEGKYGVEAVHDDVLRGKSGQEKAKRDSLGRLIDVLSTESSTSGQDLVLTLDYNLQFAVEKELQKAIEEYKADAGSIVVMNPSNGAILALAGQPTFDPNNFSSLSGEELRRFLAPAASNAYEPGSVFKPLTMAAAIDQKLVEPETTNTFGKSVNVLGKEIFNAEFKTHGKQTMTQVLENSDNVAMVWVSELLGAERLRDYFEKFGFGSKSKLDLVGEQSGRLPPLKEWNDLLRSTAAFGQGVSSTTIQLAAAYCAIANGGDVVQPHLVVKTMREGQAEVLEYPLRERVISEETARKVREILQSVVEKGHGKRAAVKDVKVGGKTGTAQVPNPEGGYYEDRHIGTFAGFFPVDSPQIVMVVRLDNPKTVEFAESSAAPTFGKVANWLVHYLGLR